MKLRRLIQTLSLAVFILLLFLAARPVVQTAALDFFLRLDPALVGASALAGRFALGAFLPALLVIALTLILGRVFCGHICPMGTTLDFGEKLTRPIRSDGAVDPGRQRSGKYWILLFVFGAGLFGTSLVFWVSPLALVTRFYGLTLRPILLLVAEKGLQLGRPLAERLDLTALVYADVKAPQYSTGLFVALFFLALFLLSRYSRRFWCRYLCPAGAILAWTSKKPLIGRRVSEECTLCGRCVRACPMAAIPTDDPAATLRRECIVCLTCRDVCPENAVSFGPARKSGPVPAAEPSLSRRGFLAAGLAGAGTAALSLSSPLAPVPKPAEGSPAPPGLLRPPGSRPEDEFLARCVRCGECMIACPTNTLQPIWLKAGFLGLFSPALTPRLGYCDPECNRCGQVCPTRAIRPLTAEERVWAKTGTAVIDRQKCLAWEHGKNCMVCDEVCRFDALDFSLEPGLRVPTPKVVEDKCAGCGYCEYFCPVFNEAAIVVTPMGSLRLNEGSFKAEARGRGLNLSIKAPAGPGYPSEEPSSGPVDLAPGFTE